MNGLIRVETVVDFIGMVDLIEGLATSKARKLTKRFQLVHLARINVKTSRSTRGTALL